MNYEDLILRTGGLLSRDECIELQEAVYDSDGDVLEVGHYTGLSTIAIAEGLIPGRRFVTVDNHQWRGVTPDDYATTVAPFVGHVDFESMVGDFQEVVPGLGPFGFVFYDAAHDWGAVASFLAVCDFDDRAVFVYDDADWTPIAELLLGMGFVQRELRPVHRHKITYTTGSEQVDLDLGKRHPDTFTLAVWER